MINACDIDTEDFGEVRGRSAFGRADVGNTGTVDENVDDRQALEGGRNGVRIGYVTSDRGDAGFREG